MDSHKVQLDLDGHASISGILQGDECSALALQAAQASDSGPGSRCLLSLDWCEALAERLQQHPAIAALIPDNYVAVQCNYFEKSLEQNWLVPIHQDLSIPVAARVESDLLRGWSKKEGHLFVQPPVAVLESLLAVRLHLDACEETDGPLAVVAGTHLQGRVDAATAIRLREAGPVKICTMKRGDALLMRPLLLHASTKASGASRRRVLHFVFGPRALPLGLQWAHAPADT